MDKYQPQHAKPEAGPSGTNLLRRMYLARNAVRDQERSGQRMLPLSDFRQGFWTAHVSAQRFWAGKPHPSTNCGTTLTHAVKENSSTAN